MNKGTLILIDIGNSNISMFMSKGSTILSSIRLESRRGITADELLVFYQTLFPKNDRDECYFALVCSVVPELNNEVRFFLEKARIRPLFLNYRMVPLHLAYERPQELGIDRLVSAYGAVKLCGTPVIVVDMGTATTFNCVDKDQCFLGGLILPGLKTSLDSLTQRGSQLPVVKDLSLPKTLIATNTVDALRAGILYGYASLVEGLLKRLWEQMVDTGENVLTGGAASLIYRLLRCEVRYEPNLLALGLLHLADELKDLEV